MESILEIAMNILIIMLAIIAIIDMIMTIHLSKKRLVLNKKIDAAVNKFMSEQVVQENHNDKNNEDLIDYDSLSVIDLKKIAQSRKIKGYYVMKKDELVKVLRKED